MKKHQITTHRLGMSILLAGSMLFIGGCASNDTDQASTTGKSVEATVPAPAAKDSIDGQTATITLTGDTFDITTVRAKPGVVTLRLKNTRDAAVRLAIRQDENVLVEGDPASGYAFRAPGGRGVRVGQVRVGIGSPRVAAASASAT